MDISHNKQEQKSELLDSSKPIIQDPYTVMSLSNEDEKTLFEKIKEYILEITDLHSILIFYLELYKTKIEILKEISTNNSLLQIKNYDNNNIETHRTNLLKSQNIMNNNILLELDKNIVIIFKRLNELGDKNDITKILGNPSTTSKFDNDIWIYIERKQTQSELKNLGRMKIYKNDVLVLEIDDYGILKKKEFYNKDDMENIKIVEATTQAGFKKNSFIYEFMSSMRQKINDPLGVRAKKRKEISQR